MIADELNALGAATNHPRMLGELRATYVRKNGRRWWRNPAFRLGRSKRWRTFSCRAST